MYFGDQDVNAIDFEAHNALPHERARDVKDVILNVGYHLVVSIFLSFFCSSFSSLGVPSHMLYSILSHTTTYTFSHPPLHLPSLFHPPSTPLYHPPQKIIERGIDEYYPEAAAAAIRLAGTPS